MLKKIASSTFQVNASDIIPAEKALHSEAITNRFRTITAEIKKVSPRSQDFLYFIARGIHAMEHAALDPVSRAFNSKLGHVAYSDNSGNCQTCGINLIKNASGETVEGLWCQASQVDPFVNQNGDAFSERELLAEVSDPQDPNKFIKAYQTFIGKGLFTDHKSAEVENIRGIILDAEYDPTSKGVDLLIALDKKAYPELARQITAGYSTDVSMGVQVNYSLCSDCGNKAITEADYCGCVKTAKGVQRAGKKMCYEANNGLNFIEISVVSNGADSRAKIKTVLASLNRLRKAQNHDNQDVESENQLILDSIDRIESEVQEIEKQVASQEKIQSDRADNDVYQRIASIEDQIKVIADQIKIGGEQMVQDSKQSKKGYFQGTVEPELGKPFDMADKNYKDYWEDDKHLHGQGMDEGPEGWHSGYGLGSDEEVKKMYLRASAEDRRKIRQNLLNKFSYFQGTVEPDLTKPFEMADKNYKDSWEDDKHLHGQGMESGADGWHPGYGLGSDENVKKELLRAKLRARLEKSANPKSCKWTVFAGDEAVLSVTAEQAYGEDLSDVAQDIDSNQEVTNFEWFASKPYGLNLIQAIKTYGLTKVAAQINKASQIRVGQAAPMAPAEMPAEAPEADMGMDAGLEAPEGETEDHAQRMVETAEALRTATDSIDEATTQISSLVDDIESEYGADAAAEGEELAGDLADAGQELSELGGEMAGMPPAAPAAQTAALKGLVRIALGEADKVLRRAEAYVTKYATDDEDLDSDGLKDKDEKYLSEKAKEIEEAEQEKKKKEASVKDRRIAARKKLRRKIAQQLYNLTEGDIVAEAHPEGGNETTFPKQPEGKVETVTEQQSRNMDVANSLPRGELVARKNLRHKVLQAAQKLVAQQSTAQEVEQASKEVDQEKQQLDQAKKKLQDAAQAKTAEVDNETRQYYKELASQSATGNKPDPEVAKFYNELTQDFNKKKATAAVHNERLRTKRAYALATKRAELGQIENTQDAVESDVDRLLLLSDEQFKHFADVIENTKKVSSVQTKKQVRTAGALNVGVQEGVEAPQSPVDAIKHKLTTIPWS